jgi:hypothetical protein
MNMEQFGLKFHHMGLAVAKPDAAVAFLKGMGYTIGQTVCDELQNVNLIFCRGVAMPDIEIVFPTDNETPGPLDAMLANNKLKGVYYHLCYETSDAGTAVEAIKNGGHKIMPVSECKPAILFGNNKVGFYLIKGFGLIEIIEKQGAAESPAINTTGCYREENS